MTQRPVFRPTTSRGPLALSVDIPFRWHPGFSATQKRKNVVALHEQARKLGYSDLLEVSTKSEDPFGRELSAFNLQVPISADRCVPVELAYQASKVFENGGPYDDLLLLSPGEAKRDIRLQTSGRLVAFSFGGKRFPLSPPNAFYDWLYIRGLVREPALVEHLQRFQGFSDIEFNPQRSLNCQARSCAIAVSLIMRGELERSSRSFAHFVRMLDGGTQPVTPAVQQELLG